MSGSEGVALRLRTTQEFRDAVHLTDAIEIAAASGQHLVRVTLMPHIEDQAVARRVEGLVDRGQELDRTKTGREVPARPRDRSDDRCAQFMRYLFDLFRSEFSEILRRIDAVQQRCGHSLLQTA